ncbi:FAD/NAD-P-binding domain-containing protein [Auriscalpium vulgare]|uniref:FAD/NAD-P-binding domain-containing protein n=1 Tax=Auriscalpium vulgare TaxID=40419 RepID=A0ACB8RJQ3_9AGAM|nr:FAD/NAD-P-binding domain-containing protein [Auriscalpium vulgare]
MLVPDADSDTKSAPRDPRQQSVGIIGAGCAGLITAHVLLEDGFTDVQVLTRDMAVGGVWMDARVYPGLQVNSLHGEFSFSAMPMTEDSKGARLTGADLTHYMKEFSGRFLEGRIRFDTEVVRIRRDQGAGWLVDVRNGAAGTAETLQYERIVLCTGGCSNPRIPGSLSQAAADAADFTGPVVHTQEFPARIDELLATVKAVEHDSPDVGNADTVVVVGGGKSAQDVSAYLANEGRKVSMVFSSTDPVLASTKPIPGCIRKSRLFSTMSPHIELHTWLEKFLHRTWVGGKIVNAFWNHCERKSYSALDIPPDSPLRHTRSQFYGVANDEGVLSSTRFHGLVRDGKIELVAPARVDGFASDGRSVILDDGRVVQARAVVLATGYKSSWTAMFDKQTRAELGLDRHPPPPRATRYHWNYSTLAQRPASRADTDLDGPVMVRGLVPAERILARDFAVNGAVITNNNGMTCEVSAHWISAYFLGDPLRLPTTVDKAREHGERHAAWMRQRYPDMLHYLNESYSTAAAVWDWPQWIDGLLEDMGLPTRRSGGNFLTWPFKVVRVQEIATLKEERDGRRARQLELL